MSEERIIKAQEEYQKMVDSIFGDGVVHADLHGTTNHVTGTWGFDNEFDDFKNNFKRILEHLNSKFTKPNDKNTFFDLVANMGDEQNWEGNYSELVAYDVLLNTDYNPNYCLNENRNVSFSLAQNMGRKGVNYDMFVTCDAYRAYFDIKSFKDTVGEILENSIINKVLGKDEFKGSNVRVLANYPLDDSEVGYRDHVRDLQNELTQHIQEFIVHNLNIDEFQSAILPQLSFIIYLEGVNANSPIREYAPYRRAESLKDFVIQRYCNKLPLDEPFFLVFVNFAWYNHIDTDSFGFNRYLFRSLARRTFMQYNNAAHNKPINAINRDYTGKEMADFAARKLTGMIFIDDHSITNKGYNVYVYTNPNADNKCDRINSYFHQVMRKAKYAEFDDFVNDNY